MSIVKMSVGAVGSVAMFVLGLGAVMPERAQAQDIDPHVGTWVLNVSKSKFSGPKPKEQTVVWTAEGEGYKVVSKTTEADGKANPVEFLVTFDGTDQPMPGFDGVSGKRPDDRTVEVTFKKGGQAVQTSTHVLSNYGKTRTATVTGVTAEGAPVKNVLVFEKKP